MYEIEVIGGLKYMGVRVIKINVVWYKRLVWDKLWSW